MFLGDTKAAKKGNKVRQTYLRKEGDQGVMNEKAGLIESQQSAKEQLRATQRLAKVGQWHLDLIQNTLHWSAGVFEIFESDEDEFGASYEAFLNAIP